MPYFSIITPTYDRPDSLSRAISSVLKQGFTDFEYIIVNNGNDDLKIPYNDSRIKIIPEKNKGANYARNTGIENASGQFICFLDDDDEYYQNHLEVLFDLIKNNEEQEALYRTYTEIEVTENEFEYQPVVLLKEGGSKLEHMYTVLLFMACVCCHKNILKKIKFDPAIPVAQDYHMWTRILISYPLVEAPVITTIYHKTKASVSSPGLKTFQNYISVFGALFQMEEVKKQLSKRTRDATIFRYYNFILHICIGELSFRQFVKFSLESLKYKPLYMFSMDYLKLTGKFFKINRK